MHFQEAPVWADCPQTLMSSIQTCLGHSNAKGLLVTKQPLPYLLLLPCSLATNLYITQFPRVRGPYL